MINAVERLAHVQKDCSSKLLFVYGIEDGICSLNNRSFGGVPFLISTHACLEVRTRVPGNQDMHVWRSEHACLEIKFGLKNRLGEQRT